MRSRKYLLAGFAASTMMRVVGVLMISCLSVSNAVSGQAFATSEVAEFSLRPEWIDAAVDSSGRVHVAVGIRSGTPFYHYTCYAYEGDGWQIEQLPGYRTNDLRNADPAIAVDHSGVPHILRFDEPTDSLRHYWKDGVDWESETVSSTAYPAYYDLAVSPSGQLCAAYYAGAAALTLAIRDDHGVWHTQATPSAWNYPYCSAVVAFDPDGYPHLVHGGKTANGEGLHHTWEDAQGWSTELVDSRGTYGIAMVIDSEGVVHLLQEAPSDTLSHWWKSAGWQSEGVATGDRGSLALKADDTLCAAFYDGDLAYAERVEGTWTTQTIADHPDWQSVRELPRLFFRDGVNPVVYYVLVNHSSLWECMWDVYPPTPDPMSFAAAPSSPDEDSITMEAAAASDPSGVEYLFDETSGNPGGTDSGWQAGTTYTDSGLDDSTEYCYRVKARDGLGWEGEWSAPACAVVLEDTTPPACAADCWPTWPYESAPGEISTDLGIATDPSGVEYCFEETSGNPGGDDSGWQDAPEYTDTGLLDSTQYCYRAKIRDKSTNRNETDWFGPRCATTSDQTPPTPDPMAFDVVPQAVGERSIRMVARTASDMNGPIDYYFTETSGNPRGTWSVWQESTELVDWGLQPNTTYCYNVRARDNAPAQNETTASAILCARTNHPPVPTGAPGIDWKGFSHGEGPEYPSPWSELKDVAVDPSGNVYAVGELGWDDGSEDWNGVAVVTKYASDGTQLWHDLYELPDSYCHPRAACTDDAGNLYVVGAWAPPDSTAWPGWFLTKMSPDGHDVSTYSSDSSWIVLYSVDVDAEGNAYVCGNCWREGWFTGKFEFASGDYVWTHCYGTNPATDNLEDRVEGVLGTSGYYVAKNYSANENDGMLMVRHRLSDGIVDKSVAYDLAAGTEELVTALAADAYGQLVGTVWVPGSNSGQIVKFAPELNLQWNMTVTTDAMPYLSLRGVTTGPDWTIYAVGREGNREPLWENDEDSHAFVFCTTGDGTYLWDHTYDAGGPSEKEWGVADGVGCAPDGTQTYVGATLSYSETSWARSLSILAYGDDPVEVENDPTAASFRIVAETGEVRGDGTVYAAEIGASAADVAEWVCVSEPVEPGNVLEHDPERPGCYRLSASPRSMLIAGVVSTEPGITLGDGTIRGDRALLALTGIVPVKVTDEGGPILPGDLLVSSSTPGYAMRWAGANSCPCSLIGKALEPMTETSGVVLVLLTAH